MKPTPHITKEKPIYTRLNRQIQKVTSYSGPTLQTHYVPSHHCQHRDCQNTKPPQRAPCQKKHKATLSTQKNRTTRHQNRHTPGGQIQSHQNIPTLHPMRY